MAEYRRPIGLLPFTHQFGTGVRLEEPADDRRLVHVGGHFGGDPSRSVDAVDFARQGTLLAQEDRGTVLAHHELEQSAVLLSREKFRDKRLIALRHEESTLVYGDYDLLLPEDDAVYAYTRTDGADQLLVVLNWNDESQQRDLAAAVDTERGDLLLSNYETSTDAESLSSLSLGPYEARVYRL